MHARLRPLGTVLGALALLMLTTACAAQAPGAPRTNHDALYRGATGEGDYDVDPVAAAVARRGPARPPPAPAAEAPKPCEHVWEFMDRATHAYIDPATGMPALCTPRYCPKCGLVVHECQRPRR